jgi:hypothetical protein
MERGRRGKGEMKGKEKGRRGREGKKGRER